MCSLTSNFTIVIKKLSLTVIQLSANFTVVNDIGHVLDVELYE